jgi:hypothetical protein
MNFFDLCAVIFAGPPIVFLLVFIGIIKLATPDPPAQLLHILTVTFITIVALWLVAGIYNVIGLFRRRSWPLIGMMLNVLAFLIWSGLYLAMYLFPL